MLLFLLLLMVESGLASSSEDKLYYHTQNYRILHFYHINLSAAPLTDRYNHVSALKFSCLGILFEVLNDPRMNAQWKPMLDILHCLCLSQSPLRREELYALRCITDDRDIIDDTL